MGTVCFPFGGAAGSTTATLGIYRTVSNSTADATLTVAETGTLITNLGDADTNTQTLPASPTVGTTYTFAVVAAFELRIDPNAADHLIYSGGAMADGEYLSSSTVGSTITVTALSSGDWICTGETGLWSEETP